MEPQNRNRIILTLLILLILGGATVYLIYNQIDPPQQKTEVVAVQPDAAPGNPTITRINKRRAEKTDPIPDLDLRKLDGSPLKLSDFPGKLILLQVWFPNILDSVAELKSLQEHSDYFQSDPRFTIISATSDQGSGSFKSAVADLPPHWTHAIAAPDAGAATRDFLSVPNRLLIMDGQILAQNLSGWDAFSLACELLPRVKPTQPDGTIIDFEQIANQNTTPLPFRRIPPPSPTDAATRAKIEVVDGRLHGQSGRASVLIDGQMPASPDSPPDNFFFIAKSISGRFVFDLERPIPIAQINSYTWHIHDRSPQVFRVYGSDGAGSFDPAPKFGVDPAKVGWTLIADLDTRPAPWPRGVTGISIRKTADGQSLGKFRYLLFVVFPPQTKHPQGHTFFAEIDVLEASQLFP